LPHQGIGRPTSAESRSDSATTMIHDNQPAKSSSSAQTARGTSWRFVIWYPIVAIVAYFFATHMLRPAARGGLRPGETPPPLAAAGWLNGAAPSDADLAGKVVVVDAWFAACPPCRHKAHELVTLYERFRDRVTFIGYGHYLAERIRRGRDSRQVDDGRRNLSLCLGDRRRRQGGLERGFARGIGRGDRRGAFECPIRLPC